MISRRSSGNPNSENELSIALARRQAPRPFYTSGDLVKGDVVLRNPATAFGVEATVKFTGVAKSKIGPRGNIHQPAYTSETILFQYTQQLGTGVKAGQGSQRDTQTAWPFEFTFPSGTRLLSQKQRYSSDPRFHRNPGHALPPSFSAGSRAEESDRNTISYVLEATITKPYPTHPFQPGTLKNEKAIPFCPVRDMEVYQPTLTPIVKPVTLSGDYLSGPEESNEWDRTRGYSTSPQTPHLSFDIKIQTPQTTCAGAKLPMFIGVDYDLEKSTDQTMPAVYLSKVQISLESRTQVRTPAPFLGLGQESQEGWSDTTHLAESGPINIPLTENWDMHELIKTLSINSTAIPSFKTFNIARTYVLHTDIAITCALQPFTIKLERPLTILPAVSRTATCASPRVMMTPRPRIALEDPPPPYEQHEGEAAAASGMGIGMYRLPSFDTALQAG